MYIDYQQPTSCPEIRDLCVTVKPWKALILVAFKVLNITVSTVAGDSGELLGPWDDGRWITELGHVVSILWYLPTFAGACVIIYIHNSVLNTFGRWLFHQTKSSLCTVVFMISASTGGDACITMYNLQRWINNADCWRFPWFLCSLRLVWLNRAIHSKVAPQNDGVTHIHTISSHFDILHNWTMITMHIYTDGCIYMYSKMM